MKELIKEGIEKDRHRGLIIQIKLEGEIRLLLTSLERILESLGLLLADLERILESLVLLLVNLVLLLVNLERILVSLMFLLVSLEQILVKHRNEHAFFLCHVRCILNSKKSSLY
ncbi:hypothetical protein P4555_19875 [Peribacillus frigoritolerans]|uniref:hypothetical protein n=1 Tax=Peribacillus frigoritolerans TaxID=450367 RepID=UPI002E215164|nr:hypothetical protein [Peribacillus frigoritolerans]